MKEFTLWSSKSVLFPMRIPKNSSSGITFKTDLTASSKISKDSGLVISYTKMNAEELL